jgi:hypothetical protein
MDLGREINYFVEGKEERPRKLLPPIRASQLSDEVISAEPHRVRTKNLHPQDKCRWSRSQAHLFSLV